MNGRQLFDQSGLQQQGAKFSRRLDEVDPLDLPGKLHALAVPMVPGKMGSHPRADVDTLADI